MATWGELLAELRHDRGLKAGRTGGYLASLQKHNLKL